LLDETLLSSHFLAKLQGAGESRTVVDRSDRFVRSAGFSQHSSLNSNPKTNENPHHEAIPPPGQLAQTASQPREILTEPFENRRSCLPEATLRGRIFGQLPPHSNRKQVNI
jgi:hypothetical protein